MVAGRRTGQREADADGIRHAAATLRQGGLVAFPTETVYGLGADARSGSAVADLYAAKGRPAFNPLIAHVASLGQAEGEGRFSDAARALASAFWPGPLTLVVPASARCSVCDLARAGLESVALRVPDHPVARAVLQAANIPVAAPSANRSGRISPTEAAHVTRDLTGLVDLILDGGSTPIGVESTIVSCLAAAPVLLRPGGIPREAIERVLGRTLTSEGAEVGLVAPGMLASHYAPRAAVRLDATATRPHEAGLDFGGQLAAFGRVGLDLSPRGDLREAAANLFGFLHRLDASGAAGIAVAPIPHHDLGEAINDRLRRAAAPRS